MASLDALSKIHWPLVMSRIRMAIIIDIPLSQSSEKSANRNDDHGLIGLKASFLDSFADASAKLRGFVPVSDERGSQARAGVR